MAKLKFTARIHDAEPTGRMAVRSVKRELTEDEIAVKGQTFARNLTVEIPNEKEKLAQSLEPYEKRLTEVKSDTDYRLSQIPLEDDCDPENVKELMKAMQEQRSVEGQIKSLQLQTKVRVSVLELENSLLEHHINLGYEMVDVECEWYVSWNAGKKQLIACANGEVFETQRLSDEEKQMNLLDGVESYDSMSVSMAEG